MGRKPLAKPHLRLRIIKGRAHIAQITFPETEEQFDVAVEQFKRIYFRKAERRPEAPASRASASEATRK